MNRVAISLSRLWLRCLGNQFLRVSTIKLPNGSEQKVVVFSSKTFFTLGQVTPWGTILVHEFAFLIDKLGDYVITHESAHKRQLCRYLVYPLTALWLLVPLLILSVIMMVIQAIVTHESVYFAMATMTMITAAVALAIPALFSWILEFMADCHAIKELGMSNIVEGIAEGKVLAEARGYKKPDMFSLMFSRLTHPPLSWTYHICRFLHRNTIIPTL
jgi:hypothetical protein